MKSIKIMGLCLVAVFALSAVVASSAFAEKPEFLFPNNEGKKQFSSIETAGTLETRKGEEVKCTGGRDTGEVSGAKEARDILITYTGCIAKVGTEEFKCQSESAKSEEIKTYDLAARIGFDTKPKVGILFHPETGRENNPNNLFAVFECINDKTGGKNINIRVKGSVIGLIIQTNTLIEPHGTNEFFEITFAKKTGEKGIPEDRKLEGETENNKLLSLTTFTTKEKVKETGGEEGWIESAAEGTAKVYPLESMKICTE
jgi:hypothetical protein